jgi:hypothetical protein
VSVRVRRVIVALAVATLALVVPRTTTAASGGCSADSTVLGQLPSFTGSTATEWINVFGLGLDPAGTWIVTFSVPVMPWPLPAPLTYDPNKALTSLAMPSDPSGGFKWTVRARDMGVNSLTIHVSDGTCSASHLVVLVPNTSTEPRPSGMPFPLLAALIGGALGAVFVLRPRRDRPDRG